MGWAYGQGWWAPQQPQWTVERSQCNETHGLRYAPYGGQPPRGSGEASADQHWGAPARPQRLDSGQLACLYVWVGDDALCSDVAKDLRNQAPSILLVVCDSSDIAASMKNYLEEDPKDEPDTRGDGKKGGGKGKRAGADQFQVQYMCECEGTCIVAGRRGIVKNIKRDEYVELPPEDPSGGMLLIATVHFGVAVMGIMSMSVAVLDVQVRGSGPEVCELPAEEASPSPWADTTEKLALHNVRVLAGEFAAKGPSVVEAIRQSVRMTPAAVDLRKGNPDLMVHGADTLWMASSAMFILGPVLSVRTLIKDDPRKWDVMTCMTRGGGVKICDAGDAPGIWPSMSYALLQEVYLGGAGKDESKGWTVIEDVKEKKSRDEPAGTKKLFVFMGCKESRRDDESWQRRKKW